MPIALFSRVRLISLIAASVVISNTGHAEVRVRWLGGTGSATACSYDGRIVTGYTNDNTYFAWTIETGLQILPMQSSFGGITISGDGQVFAGSLTDQSDQIIPFRWTPLTGLQNLGGTCGSCALSVSATSYNGTIAVGQFVDYAFGGQGEHPAMWDLSGSISFLPTLAGAGGQITGCSGDGTVMSGVCMDFVGEPYFIRNRPTMWRNGAITNLGLPRGDDWGAATDVSSDGTTVIGYSTNGAFTGPEGHAFYWTQDEGLVTLPIFGDQQYIVAAGVSGDGKKIVGWVNERNRDAVAFIWSAEIGVVDLKSYINSVSAYNIFSTSDQLIAATGISADGTTIVGYGNKGNGEEPFVATLSPDQDLDGIPDDWEINGVPYIDSHGALHRYLLDADGDGTSDANPLRKDIFVEVDSMSGMLPYASTFEIVKEAFDRAPVKAPRGLSGGLPGVNLHIARDEVHLPARDYPNNMTDFQVDRAAYFGTQSDRADPEWNARRKARAKVFRYCIFAQASDDPDTLGLGEVHGDDFMVVMKGFRSLNPPPSIRLDQITEASTFMHELGHTLGLEHGGNDAVNYKPNYFSVMNYTWNMPFWMSEDEYIRYFPNYSNRRSALIEEDRLREGNAVDGSLNGVTFPRSLDVGQIQCELGNACSTFGTGNCVRAHWMDQPVDWNSDCQIDASTTYSSNINNLGSQNDASHEGLYGWNDWANLRYSFLGSPNAVDGSVFVPTHPEPRISDFQTLRDNRPGPGCVQVITPSEAAIAPNQSVTIAAHISSTQAVQSKWQALTPSGRLISDLTDGPFEDERTGATYIVSGASTPQLTLASIVLGSQTSLHVSCVAWNNCGSHHSAPITITACKADLNGDGVLDFFDYLDFVALFAGNDPLADFNLDQIVDFFDYLDFVAAFSAGC